jgi:predicted glycosyltransferase involved in capsule biosynthesis
MYKKITINLSFYNQNKVLIDHINLWKSYSSETKKQFSFCVVDDCSKTPADEVLSGIDLTDLDINIYRVTEDLYCNIAGARNLAATMCQTDWMVILDMDTMISEELAIQMLDLTDAHPGNCFKFNRRVNNHIKNNQTHPAVCLLRKDDYWNVGGCEEDLVGHYGFTDPSFWHRARGKLKINERRDLYLDYIPDGEADIQRNISYNSRLFEHKKATNSWSTDFIRFQWKKIS